MTTRKLYERNKHVPRVCRDIPLVSIKEVNTLFGAEQIILTKHCPLCKTIQPIGNFYAKAKRKRRGKTPDVLTGNDMERVCIYCWDNRKRNVRKEKKTTTTVIEFY